MKRETINEILAEAGIEVNKAVVTNLMNAFNDEIRNVRVESANKAIEDFKGWHSHEEYQALEGQIAELKDASNKASRTSKYKEAGLKAKWFEYADSKLKDEEDLEKALKKFKKDNEELFEVEQTPTPEPQDDDIDIDVTFGAQKGKTNPSEKLDPVSEAFYKMNPDLAK